MTQELTNSSDPRMGLAKDRTTMATYRTSLALDRTTLAWIRTALTMGTFGFGLVAFFRAVRQANPSAESVRLHEGAIFFGTSLIILGIAATSLAGLLHLYSLRRLRRGELPVVTILPLSVALALLLSIAGLGGIWSLFAR